MTISRTYALGVQEAQLRFDFGAFPENALELGIRPKLGERYSNSIFSRRPTIDYSKESFSSEACMLAAKSRPKRKKEEEKVLFQPGQTNDANK